MNKKKIRANGAKETGERRTAGLRSANNHSQNELSAALSASLTSELLREIEGLSSADDAALWVKRRLPAKNQLVTSDAQRVEVEFEAKLTRLNDSPRAALAGLKSKSHRNSIAVRASGASQANNSRLIDKSKLPFPEPRRIRDKTHVKYITKQPCLICGRRPSDAHHLRFAQFRALGRKVSDEFTVPLCRTHHREVHNCSDEIAWWQRFNLDPRVQARQLWLKTHGKSQLSSLKPFAPTADGSGENRANLGSDEPLALATLIDHQ